ncbi:hypothetical protein [Actinoplanes friuliensis]|uniref:Uncharacterized protein n=1 Tax=Actinoplanes friuliensis DSM 7358 TaxID=1246995 RepID=U5W440_9ACTN|nr:hypothetical protein [Actinoplanes friuliensis]AGZ42676.1 hypothetical protein AFR_22030 [Actinoplanes friuliensis DSM 7358]
MRTAPVIRSLLATTYLLALVLHGRWNSLSAVLAASVVAVWAFPLIRDARLRRGTEPLSPQ